MAKHEILWRKPNVSSTKSSFLKMHRSSAETETQIYVSVNTQRTRHSRGIASRRLNKVLIVLRNRVDAFGVSEPSIRREANHPRIIVELPGAKDSSKPLQIVKTMGRLEFKLVKKSPTGGSLWSGTSDTPIPDSIPDDSEVRYHYETGNWYVLESPCSPEW